VIPPKPTFDLIGVVLTSITLTGLLAAGALALGLGVGVLLIRRNRSRASWSEEHGLNLG
jgi:hypothetical protein